LSGMRLAGSEKIDWLVTALLHEALHLPGSRGPAGSNGGFAVGATHAVAQYTGSLSGALTSKYRHRMCGKGWIGA